MQIIKCFILLHICCITLAQENCNVSQNIYFTEETDSLRSFNWEVGDEWELAVTLYPKWEGVSIQAPSKEVALENFEKRKEQPLAEYTVFVKVKDTVKIEGKDCWELEFTGFIDDVAMQKMRFKSMGKDINSNKYTLWVEKHTANQVLSYYEYPLSPMFGEREPIKINDYLLLHSKGYFPTAFVPYFAKEDSVIIGNKQNGLKKIVFNSEQFEQGKKLSWKNVKNEMKEGDELHEEYAPYYHDGYEITWDRNKKWWTSYSAIQDGNVTLEATLIEK